jgi:undecaprenyl-diphosphatase
MNEHLLYDWFGYNKTVFYYLNNITNNPLILNILKFFTDYIGNYTMFPVHFLILIFTAYRLSHIHKKDLAHEILYVNSILILLSSLMLAVTLGTLAKSNFSFPRPYCLEDINLNKTVSSIMYYSKSKCLKSFPSGHTLYATTFILSIWPMLNKPFRAIGVIIILITMTSRVILGAHFPADVLYGALMAMFVVLIARNLIKHVVIKPTLKKLKTALDL